MRTVELSDEAFAALQRLAAAKNVSPSDLLAALLGAGKSVSGDRLLFHLANPEFARLATVDDRYLALLAWVAQHYACDFADFVSHQESGRRYLMLDRDRLNGLRAHNHARQIGGTQFWAVMAIDDATKARFVRRLLEFVGCHDETVAQAIRAVGLESAEAGGFRLRAV